MADLDPRSLAGDDRKAESPAPSSNAADALQRNGSADARVTEGEVHASSGPGSADTSPQEPAAEQDDRSGLDRAEKVVDHLAGRLSSLMAVWGRKFLRLTARARESAQDFWADVQDFRHGKKP